MVADNITYFAPPNRLSSYENIIKPSQVISDQYGSIVVTQSDGTQIIGREADEEKKAVAMTNPSLPDSTIGIDRDAIQTIKPHPVSVMPS